jgi:putative transposase
MPADVFKTATHTPAHLLQAGAYYMISGAIYQHAHLLDTDERKRAWYSAFSFAASRYAWEIKAWVVLANHYHAIVQAPETGVENLPKFVASYHKFTATQWNIEDQEPGRQVWWNYWDTCLWSEADYRARWNYVHWNPVRHKLAAGPEDYAFSSYRQFFGEAPGDVRRFEQMYPFEAVDDVPEPF